MTSTMSARLGLACGLAALAMASVPARAEEGVAIKNFLGNMGLISPERDTIRYRERAPLVLPPKMDLRAPSAGSLAATNPQWPKDPDVEAKNKRAAEERKPVTYSETRRMSENNPRLSVDELRAGRDPNARAEIDPKGHRGDNARDVLLLSPNELRSKAKPDDDVLLAAGAEPDRRSLTEPPTGMRKSASGTIRADNSAPRIDQQQQDANPINWLTRKFSSSDED
ncbi:MAG TPA: hypothetical protein VGO82_00225 [Enterovirga sp.]|jgi:hypothetical protein|nr:hypothetical protein [Enterovirga sp.]